RPQQVFFLQVLPHQPGHGVGKDLFLDRPVQAHDLHESAQLAAFPPDHPDPFRLVPEPMLQQPGRLLPFVVAQQIEHPGVIGLRGRLRFRQKGKLEKGPERFVTPVEEKVIGQSLLLHVRPRPARCLPPARARCRAPAAPHWGPVGSCLRRAAGTRSRTARTPPHTASRASSFPIRDHPRSRAPGKEAALLATSAGRAPARPPGPQRCWRDTLQGERPSSPKRRPSASPAESGSLLGPPPSSTPHFRDGSITLLPTSLTGKMFNSCSSFPRQLVVWCFA